MGLYATLQTRSESCALLGQQWKNCYGYNQMLHRKESTFGAVTQKLVIKQVMG